MTCEPNILSIAIDIFKTILGVAIGAWLAFKVNRRAQDVIKRDTELAAATIATFCLSRQWNDYRVFGKEIANYQNAARTSDPSLPPWDTLPKQMQLPTIPKRFDASANFDFDKLYFLFGKGHESLLGELSISQNRYANFSHYVETFNALKVQAHQKLSDAVDGNFEFSIEKAERLLGHSLYTQLEFYAKAVLESIPANMHHIEKIAPMLEDALTKKFGPGALIMKLRF